MAFRLFRSDPALCVVLAGSDRALEGTSVGLLMLCKIAGSGKDLATNLAPFVDVHTRGILLAMGSGMLSTFISPQ
ncbi:hypothetical protein BDV12DRAFT_172176 [Aspergillus spectabilis]